MLCSNGCDRALRSYAYHRRVSQARQVVVEVCGSRGIRCQTFTAMSAFIATSGTVASDYYKMMGSIKLRNTQCDQ
jgi:hypothetical protein